MDANLAVTVVSCLNVIFVGLAALVVNRFLDSQKLWREKIEAQIAALDAGKLAVGACNDCKEATWERLESGDELFDRVVETMNRLETTIQAFDRRSATADLVLIKAILGENSEDLRRLYEALNKVVIWGQFEKEGAAS
ncbi:MAG: hypothetical protein KKB20_12545 [Proteobacteria bacterium]|nr:hypothetical protein [Pseudomonadota bacterium]